MAVSPEMLKIMMDYTGVNAAVLQCGNVYGKLNNYYREVMQKNPWAEGVLYPLARIDENTAKGSRITEVLEGLFFDGFLKGLWFAGSAIHFSPEYDEFWKTIKNLKIPVFLAFFPDKNWVHVFSALGWWASRFADIPCVLAQAFPLSAHKKDDQLEIPDYTRKVIQNCNFLIELIYPIGRGVVEQYPFRMSMEAVHKLYDTFGPEKLVWGSDIPMVERYCTYAQSLQYLWAEQTRISAGDMEKIIGGNLKKFFRKIREKP
jgi:predicted TIM-barrel fold metal-dependent hydrolase